MLNATRTFVYEWQTLIAGVLALAGAVITVIALNKQSRQESERKRRAARAMLPAAFIVLFSYALECIRWLEGVREKATLAESGSIKGPISVATCPRPDGGMTAQLRDCVEHFKDEPSQFVAKLLSKLQIQQSRIASLQDYFINYPLYDVKRSGLGRNIDDYIADSVELVAFGTALFPYARMQTDVIPMALDLSVVSRAFRECHLDEVKNVGAWNALTAQFRISADSTHKSGPRWLHLIAARIVRCTSSGPPRSENDI